MTESNTESTRSPGVSAGDDTVVRGTAFAFAARVVSGLFTGALTVFLARRLGSSGYGVFALALSIEALLYLAADFGVSQALPRFIVESRGDPFVLRELVGAGIRLKLLGSVVVSTALVAFAGLIAEAYGSPKLTWALRGVAISLVGVNFINLAIAVFTALRRQAMTLTAFSVESATEVTASVALVLIAGGAVAAAFGRAIGYSVGAAAGLWLMFGLLRTGGAAPLERPRRHVSRIVGDAWALLVVDGAYSLFAQIDSLLIGAFLTVRAVGVWQAPLRLVVLLVYPGQAISSAVAPRLVRSESHRAEPETFSQAVRVLVVLMAAVTAVSTAWATPIIGLTLGSSFHGSADVLRALAPFVFLSGLGPLVSVGMNYLGEARRRIPIAVATVVLNVIVDLILIPRIGVLGGAVGTDAAYLVYVPAHYLYCRRALNVPVKPTAWTLGRSLLAGGVMALVLAAVGTGNLGFLELVGGGILGTSAFVGVLLITHEVTPSELITLWAAARRRARRRKPRPAHDR